VQMGDRPAQESVPIWKKEHAADGTYWIEGDELVDSVATERR